MVKLKTKSNADGEKRDKEGEKQHTRERATSSMGWNLAGEKCTRQSAANEGESNTERRGASILWGRSTQGREMEKTWTFMECLTKK